MPTRVSRKEQNRIAQRRFRQKKTREAEETREKLGSLTAKYEVLLQQHESLKDQLLVQGGSLGGMLEDVPADASKPSDFDWESWSSLSSESVDPTCLIVQSTHVQPEEKRDEFALDTQQCHPPHVPAYRDLQSSDASAVAVAEETPEELLDETARAGLSPVRAASSQLPSTRLPSSSSSSSSASSSSAQSLSAHAQAAPCWQAAESCTLPSDWPDLPDLLDLPTQETHQSDALYGWPGALSIPQPLSQPPPQYLPQPFPPSVPDFGVGFANEFASPGPKVDLVQAVIQAGMLQEHIAYFQLETARLQAVQCGYGQAR
jgi:hypothetical protein